VASYNPFVSLYWLVTGRTIGGTSLYGAANRLDRTQALRLWTGGSAWFSGEEAKKGAIGPGQLADLAVLSADYLSAPDEEIKDLESVLTIVGGEVVHGSGRFGPLAPPPLPASPTWAPALAGPREESLKTGGTRRTGGRSFEGHAFGQWGCGCFV